MPKLCCICEYYIRRIRRMCQRNEHFPYVSSPAKGNFVLEFPSIKSNATWRRRQVWLARMRQRDACWAGEVSLTGSHIATLGNSSPVSSYLYIDLSHAPPQLAALALHPVARKLLHISHPAEGRRLSWSEYMYMCVRRVSTRARRRMTKSSVLSAIRCRPMHRRHSS